MKDELLRYNNKQKYLIFDFETCNLNLVSSSNRPWQLSFIIATKDKILEKHDHFLKWEDLKVSDGAQRATGFDYTKYKIKAEEPLPILRKFDKLLYDKKYMIVGHNLLGFDIYVHNTLRKSLGLKTDFSYLDRLIDTNCLAKAYRENLEKPKDNLLSWQYKLINDRSLKAKVSQGTLLKFFDIDHDESKLHNALYDIKKCFEVFCELKRRMNL